MSINLKAELDRLVLLTSGREPAFRDLAESIEDQLTERAEQGQTSFEIYFQGEESISEAHLAALGAFFVRAGFQPITGVLRDNNSELVGSYLRLDWGAIDGEECDAAALFTPEERDLMKELLVQKPQNKVATDGVYATAWSCAEGLFGLKFALQFQAPKE
ncbi:MAG: hypothetical protein GY871_04390 [Actinomycetales bacterium]|nr:hypothetical protein [Actinomycetales bacterium]